MADSRVSFVPLEDVSSGAGLPLHKAVEGDAAAGKNSFGALTAKDGSGNLQYPKVNAQRELVVSLEADDVANLYDTGTATGNNSTFQDVVTIVLQNSKIYRNLSWLAGCFRDAEFKVVHNDNGTPSDVLLGILCGAGDFTSEGVMKAFTFTSGATGTQELKLQAKNLNTASDFRGALAIEEVQ